MGSGVLAHELCTMASVPIEAGPPLHTTRQTLVGWTTVARTTPAPRLE
jgi:hypothetical protein